MKNNGKEFFIAFFGSLAANVGLMILFYYLHAKQGMFGGIDVARFTSIAIVITPLIAGIVCYARHKQKDDRTGAVAAVALMSFAAAFMGCICGAMIAANLFGKING